MDEHDKETNDRIRAEIDAADNFHGTLRRMKENEDHDTWVKMCYGMYVGIRHAANMLCRMSMLECIKESATDMELFIQSYIDQIEDEMSEIQQGDKNE